MKKSIVAIAESLVVSVVAYGGTLYVSTGGSDENDGLTSATPLKTVQHAYEVAQAAILGGESEMTVYLASGTHSIQKTVADEKPQFVVTDPVKFVGQGNSPSDVTLRLQYTMDWDGAYDASVVTLNNTGAALVNLTVADGFIFNWGGASTQGAGVSILHGVVSNCVVRNCSTRGNNSHAAGVFLGNSDAILTHTIVQNCSTYETGINAENWQWSKVGGVQMNAGRIENGSTANCRHIASERRGDPA